MLGAASRSGQRERAKGAGGGGRHVAARHSKKMRGGPLRPITPGRCLKMRRRTHETTMKAQPQVIMAHGTRCGMMVGVPLVAPDRRWRRTAARWRRRDRADGIKKIKLGAIFLALSVNLTFCFAGSFSAARCRRWRRLKYILSASYEKKTCHRQRHTINKGREGGLGVMAGSSVRKSQPPRPARDAKEGDKDTQKPKEGKEGWA